MSRDAGPATGFGLPRGALLLAVVAYGAAGLAWIGLEDNSLLWVSLLGAGGATLAAALIADRRVRTRPVTARQWLLAGALAGLAIGLAAAPFAAVLMALKVSLHGHATPDFAPEAVLAVLGRTPRWGLIGGLLGTAAAMVGLARRRR